MESRLRQERKKHKLSLEALAEIAGVEVSTASRWENRQSTPSEGPLAKLCEHFGLTAKELGVDGDIALPQDAAFKRQAQDPISRLASLVELPLCPYDEAYLKLWHLCEVIMSDPTRRTVLQGALSLLASIPIEGVQRSWQWEGVLQRLNVAVAACEELSASANGADLLLAFNNVSTYIPLLTTIARDSEKLQAQAIDLAARCAILKTILGWHCADNTATIGYAKDALRLSAEAFKASGDPSLWLSAYSKLACAYSWAFSYGERDEEALKTAYEAQQLLLLQDPKKVSACIYGGIHSMLAFMQAKTGQDPADALLVAASQDPGDRAVAFMEFTRADVPLEAGWAYYYAGNYAMASEELKKIIDPSTLVLKMPEQSERMRLDTLHVIALTSLQVPDRDMQEIVTLWTAYLAGAKALDSTAHINDARGLHHEMTIAFPGDGRIAELRTLLPPRAKKR